MAQAKDRARKLEGQRAIVTGASSGIGAGVATALAEAGCSVVVNYAHDEDGARGVVKTIEQAGGHAFAFQADVASEGDVAGLFRRTIEAYGGVDIVVCNAGIQRDAALADMTLEQWNEVIGTNLTGTFLCAREAVRAFRKRGMVRDLSRALGKILCISSVHDIIPWAGHANYAASKGGVLMFMKSLAQELAAERIRVNGISPGAIRTNINKDAWQDPAQERELLKLIPYGRVGDPEDVARAAVWLVSDEADYVTGATLYVDGGMTLYPAFREGG